MATAATADAVTTPTQAASSTVPTGSWTEVVWVGPRSPGGTRTHLPAVGAAGSALTSACAHAARHSLPIHESGGHTLRSSLGCPIATYCRPRQYKNTCGGGRAMLKYDALPRLGRTRRVCSGMVAFQACSPSDGSKAPKASKRVGGADSAAASVSTMDGTRTVVPVMEGEELHRRESKKTADLPTFKHQGSARAE